MRHTIGVGKRQKGARMSKQTKNSGGLLVCGACAVIADSARVEPTSIDMLFDGIKHITSKIFNRA